MKSDYEKAIQKYFTACIILGVMLILLWNIAYFTMRSYIGAVISFFALLLIIKFAIRMIANKTLCPVLFEKLDAFAFQKIINDKRFVAPVTYRIGAAIFTGDYQTVVNIAVSQMRKKKCSIKVKSFCLSILARAYFELRDFEKLRALLAKYEEYKEQYPSKSFLRTTDSVWRYYQYFLDQNYEACKAVCRERDAAHNPKAWGAKIQKLQNDFLYAVACYENRETDAAKESFEHIISYAPRMNVASISQKYVEAIDQNRSPLLPDTEVLPDDSYQMHDARTAAKIRRYGIIKRIVIIIVVALLALTYYIDKREKDEIRSFEVKLNDALAEKYGEAVWIDHFGLEKGEVYVASLCLAKNGNELDLVEVVSSDRDVTFDVLTVVEDIEIDSYYCTEGPFNDYYIGYEISSKEPAAEPLYYLSEFDYNNNTYWFYIDYIEIIPKN